MIVDYMWDFKLLSSVLVNIYLVFPIQKVIVVVFQDGGNVYELIV